MFNHHTWNQAKMKKVLNKFNEILTPKMQNKKTKIYESERFFGINTWFWNNYMHAHLPLWIL